MAQVKWQSRWRFEYRNIRSESPWLQHPNTIYVYNEDEAFKRMNWERVVGGYEYRALRDGVSNDA